MLDGIKQFGILIYQVFEIFFERRSGYVYLDMWSVGCIVLELFLELFVWLVFVDIDFVVYIVGCMKDKKKLVRFFVRFCNKIQLEKQNG